MATRHVPPVTHQPRHPDGHCDRVEKTCTVSNAGLLTIPCGSLDPKEESVSFTYQLQNGTVLDHEPSEFLTFNASRTAHNGLVVCCNTNASIYSVCYRINVTCECKMCTYPVTDNLIASGLLPDVNSKYTIYSHYVHYTDTSIARPSLDAQDWKGWWYTITKQRQLQ